MQIALPCDLNPNQCKNGATCTNDNEGGYSCTCETGYAGDNCDISKYDAFPSHNRLVLWTLTHFQPTQPGFDPKIKLNLDFILFGL